MHCVMQPPCTVSCSRHAEHGPDYLQHAAHVRLVEAVRGPGILDARVLPVQVGRHVVVLDHEQQSLADLGLGQRGAPDDLRQGLDSLGRQVSTNPFHDVAVELLDELARESDRMLLPLRHFR